MVRAKWGRNVLRRAIFILSLILITAGVGLARSVVLIEKRQSIGVSYPIEDTKVVKLADGSVAQLVTCCGLNQDDSATFTVRDGDGYTLVDHKFSNGRFFLSPEGRVVAIQKIGPSFTVTFHDSRLKVIKQLNLVNVNTLAAGDRGSIAVLLRQGSSMLLRVFDSGGESRWEVKDLHGGNLYFLPGEAQLAVTDGKLLSLYSYGSDKPRVLDAKAAVQYVGIDPGQNRLFLAVAAEAGPEIWAINPATLEPVWKQTLGQIAAGHCQNMMVEFSRYVSSQNIVALLLRCSGDRNSFYVARFLNTDGQVIGQEKLGRRIDAGFYEVKNNLAIVSDGFTYTFSIRD